MEKGVVRGPSTVSPTRSTEAPRQPVSPDMEECARRCLDCYAICRQAFTYSMVAGGSKSESHHLRLLMACASICKTAADFLLLGSEFHSRICTVCFQVCEECAKDCEKFNGDETIMACARICRESARCCREMASQ